MTVRFPHPLSRCLAVAWIISLLFIVTRSTAEATASQELSIAIGQDPGPLDFTNTKGAVAQSIAALIVQPLVRYDSRVQLKPELAASWIMSVDARSVVFRLRNNIYFGNGEKFTPDDAAANIDKADPGIKDFGDVRVVNPDSVEVTFHNPFISILPNLARLGIRPRSSVGDPAFGFRPNGTGAYQLVSYDRGREIVLTPRAGRSYWGAAPNIARLRVLVMPDEASRIAALRRGEVQLITDLTSNVVQELKGMSRVVLVSHPISRVFVLQARIDRRPFDSPFVRQAMVTTLNKTKLVDAVTGGKGLPTNSIFYPLMEGYLRLPEIAPDPRKSVVLLRQAGYLTPLKITLGYATSGLVDRARLAQLIQSQLSDGGFSVDLQASSSEIEARSTSQLILSSFSNPTFDPAASIQWLAEGMQSLGYADPTVVNLVSKARALPRSDAIYKDIQQKLWEGMVIVPVLFEAAIAAHDTRLTGVELLPSGLISLNTVSFKH